VASSGYLSTVDLVSKRQNETVTGMKDQSTDIAMRNPPAEYLPARVRINRAEAVAQLGCNFMVIIGKLRPVIHFGVPKVCERIVEGYRIARCLIIFGCTEQVLAGLPVRTSNILQTAFFSKAE
jgi:hypothetical protein